MPWLAIGFLGLLGLAFWSRKSGGVPSQTPVWTPLQFDPSTGQAVLPANATFAVSIPATDPNAVAVLASFTNSAAPLGTGLAALNVQGPGSPPPPAWPNDGLGTAAYRLSGAVASEPQGFVGDQSMQAWTFAGVTA